jgi:hypothetical protein
VVDRYSVRKREHHDLPPSGESSAGAEDGKAAEHGDSESRDKIKDWLSPVVYLSSNWLSQIGVLVVTTAAVLWILLLPTLIRGGGQ